MTDINNVTIVGRLTRDLNASDQREFAYTPSGQARANISIAVNSRRKSGDQWVDEANYFNVTIWGKTAENLKPYLTKGKQIAIEGSLKQDRWQDKETGKTRDRVLIVANNVQLLGGKSDGGAQPSMGYPRAQSQAPQNGYGNAPVDAAPYESHDFGGMGDNTFPEDIPF